MHNYISVLIYYSTIILKIRTSSYKGLYIRLIISFEYVNMEDIEWKISG